MPEPFTLSWLLNEAVAQLERAGWLVFKIQSAALPIAALCFKKDQVLMLNVRRVNERPTREAGWFISRFAHLAGPHVHYLVVKEIDDIINFHPGGHNES